MTHQPKQPVEIKRFLRNAALFVLIFGALDLLLPQIAVPVHAYERPLDAAIVRNGQAKEAMF